jgi:ABC-type nitrate/sulfonate/bicarbonate transport system permease component
MNRRSVRNFLLRGGLIVVVVGLWQFYGSAGRVSSLILTAPVPVVEAMGHLVTTAVFWDSLRTTVIEILLSFLFALIGGVLIVFLIGRSPFVLRIFQPILTWGYLVPHVIFYPVLLLWFSIGIESKVVFASAVGMLPIAFNGLRGLQNVDPKFIRVGRAFGASSTQLEFMIKYRAALPMLLAGVRLGLGTVIINVIIGEMLAAKSGLGVLLTTANQNFDTSQTYAIILVIMILSGLLFPIIEAPYRREHRRQLGN